MREQEGLSMTSRWLDCAYRSLCFAAAIILVLVIAYSHMTNTQMLTERASRLELSMDGTAEEPFAHRILIPVSIRTMVSITPEPLLRAMEHWGAPLGKKLLPPDMPATSRPVYYYYFALLSVCSLLIYGVLSRRLFEDLFGRNRFFGPLIPSIALVLLLPFQARQLAHLYDFGVLVLMSALLYAMAAERHRLFLLLFAVSCFNKETTVLITIAYALYFFDRIPRRRFLTFVSIQLLLFIVIYGGLRYHFHTNPGAWIDYHWRGQFWWLVGLQFPDYSNFIVWLLLFSYRWGEKPIFLRRTAVLLVANAVLFIYGGFPGELRNFYESVPLLTLFVCRNLELLWRDWILRALPYQESRVVISKQVEQ